jgi:hypothetical protein
MWVDRVAEGDWRVEAFGEIFGFGTRGILDSGVESVSWDRE